MIAVRVGDRRIPFDNAHSYEYIRYEIDEIPHDNLTLFDADGRRIATFYKWDGVDAGEPS